MVSGTHVCPCAVAALPQSWLLADSQRCTGCGLLPATWLSVTSIRNLHGYPLIGVLQRGCLVLVFVVCLLFVLFVLFVLPLPHPTWEHLQKPALRTAAGRSSLAWALASLGVSPDRSWLGQFLAAAFADGLASDQVRCASLLFCIASLDFDFLVEWLGDFLEGKYGAGGGGDTEGASLGASGLDLSLRKYAALVGVLEKLAEMDSRQLRAAWLDQTLTPEWCVRVCVRG